jgi:hypothetical protein
MRALGGRILTLEITAKLLNHIELRLKSSRTCKLSGILILLMNLKQKSTPFTPFDFGIWDTS